jgi:hypothetical protein
MIPCFQANGLLPPGIHQAGWPEFMQLFAFNPHRKWLTQGLARALQALRYAGSEIAYVDGSFVTVKQAPSDYDVCWSVRNVDVAKLDPVLLDFSCGRAAMKAKYLGDLFPAEFREGASGRTFLDFFQIDKQSGAAKGIVSIDLLRLP